MTKWKSHFALGLVVLLVSACSGTENRDDAVPASGDQAETELQDRSRDSSVQPSGAEEAVTTYLRNLDELVEIARSTTDAATAAENAPRFEQKAIELSELGETLDDVDPLELQSQFADEYAEITQLTAELGKEMVRISTDPELVMVMSNAMRAYRGQ